jgi:hypothetical protein
VTVLEGAEDEELQCYLLQLVQALRFERSDKSRLSYFLVKRGTGHLFCSLVTNLLDESYAWSSAGAYYLRMLGFSSLINLQRACLELTNFMLG